MPEPETNDPNPDVIWNLLSDPRRRYVLERLHSIERRRSKRSLAHDHLPRLADCSVIAYDPSTPEVVLTADPETRRLLEAVLDSHPAVR